MGMYLHEAQSLVVLIPLRVISLEHNHVYLRLRVRTVNLPGLRFITTNLECRCRDVVHLRAALPLSMYTFH